MDQLKSHRAFLIANLLLMMVQFTMMVKAFPTGGEVYDKTPFTHLDQVPSTNSHQYHRYFTPASMARNNRAEDQVASSASSSPVIPSSSTEIPVYNEHWVKHVSEMSLLNIEESVHNDPSTATSQIPSNINKVPVIQHSTVRSEIVPITSSWQTKYTNYLFKNVQKSPRPVQRLSASPSSSSPQWALGRPTYRGPLRLPPPVFLDSQENPSLNPSHVAAAAHPVSSHPSLIEPQSSTSDPWKKGVEWDIANTNNNNIEYSIISNAGPSTVPSVSFPLTERLFRTNQRFPALRRVGPDQKADNLPVSTQSSGDGSQSNSCTACVKMAVPKDSSSASSSPSADSAVRAPLLQSRMIRDWLETEDEDERPCTECDDSDDATSSKKNVLSRGRASCCSGNNPRWMCGQRWGKLFCRC